MLERPSKLSSRKRILVTFWIFNVIVIVSLVAFALRA